MVQPEPTVSNTWRHPLHSVCLCVRVCVLTDSRKQDSKRCMSYVVWACSLH